jgi:hypothetical protein
VVLSDILLGKKITLQQGVAVWLISTILGAVAGAIILGVPKYYLLSTRGVSSQGQITALEPNNHGTVIYAYTVGEASYQGMGHAGDINAHFDDLRAGQQVTIFYSPGKPQESCLGSPDKHLNSLLRGNLFIAGFPTFFLLGLALRRVWGLPPALIDARTDPKTKNLR